MRACICQSSQLTLIGNKFMFFQRGRLLHVSVGVSGPRFDSGPDQHTELQIFFILRGKKSLCRNLDEEGGHHSTPGEKTIHFLT